MERTTSAERARLKTLIGVAEAISNGLSGRPFCWGGGEAMSKRRALRQLGIELVTASRAKKLGHELLARAKPVGETYYGAPICGHCDVYVLGVQTRPKMPNAEVS